jgi:acetylornithine/succinyldiaminopimelate/putrescine aminotransferase
VKYAQLLCSLLPENLNNVYFTNSGAEATEGAMKLAKRITGRTKFISFKNGYHGSTQGALSIMGDEYFKRKFRPLLPDTLLLEYDNVNELEKISCRTAAVILETVQAESGITVPSEIFMKQLRKKCDETGALLILDEAQAGLGRTGKMFAFEHYGIVPDILLLAKALGGGMPLGAFISSKEKMNLLTDNPVLGHITTFGGHPVSCAAGLAALETTIQQNLIASIEQKGKLFDELLVHPKIKSKHRAGLMMSLEFENFEQNKLIIDRCIENGLLTDWFLFAPERMRIAPPLIITEQEIKFASEIILQSID